MTHRLYRAFAKATTRESGAPRHSHHWLLARRAWFDVHDDCIRCAGWAIPFEEITRATAFRVRQFGIPCTVLELATSERTYQFGFNPWAKPLEHLKVPVEVKSARIRHSTFSIAVRLALVTYAVYLAAKYGMAGG